MYSFNQIGTDTAFLVDGSMTTMAPGLASYWDVPVHWLYSFAAFPSHTLWEEAGNLTTELENGDDIALVRWLDI